MPKSTSIRDSVSPDLFSQLVASLTDLGVVLVSDSGSILSWNRAAQQLFGISESQAVGQLLPTQLPGMTAIFEEFRNSKDRPEAEFSYQGRTNTTKQIFVSLRQLTSDVISLQFRTREAAKVGDDSELSPSIPKSSETPFEFKSFYRSLVETSPDGFWLIDNQSRFLDVNDAYVRLSGYSREELLAMPPSQLEAKENSDEMAQHIENIRKQGYDRFNTFHRTKEGKIWPVEVTVRYWPESGGRFVAFFRDLTDRKRFEAQLQDWELQLNSSDRRLAELVKGMSEACFTLDREYRFTFVNDACENLFKFNREQMLGNSIWEVFAKLVGTWMEQAYRKAMTEQITVNFITFSPIAERWVDIRLFPTGDGLAAFVLDIDDRKRAEDSLRASEARHARVIRGVNDGIWDWELGTPNVYMSPRWCELLGHAGEELPHHFDTFLERLHPDDVEKMFAAVRAHQETGAEYDIEIRLRHRSGEYRWFRSRGKSDRQPGEGPAYMAGSITDIHERKMAEAEIRELNANLELRVRERTQELDEAQRLAHLGSWSWLQSENLIQWTPELYRIFGLDSQKAPPSFEEQEKYFSPASWKRITEAVNTAFTEGVGYELDLEFLRPDGSPGVLVAKGEAQRDATGKIIRLRGTAQDVTVVRRAEAEVQRISERLLLATHAGKVGIWDWNLLEDRLDWDESMYALYGIAKEQFQGAYRAWLNGVHPQDRDRGNREIQEAIRGEKDFNTEFRVLWPDHSVHHIRAHGKIYRESSGRAERMIGTNWDITEMKQKEEDIRRLNANLVRKAAEVEATNKELESFSYSVSHDLRAPLRAIDGYSRILQEDYLAQLPDPAREFIQDIRANTQQMGRLIDDLLAFSRLNRHSIRKQLLPAHEFVRECFETLIKNRPDQQINFKIEPLTEFYADRSLLKQVLLNLLANALKFTGKKASPEITVGEIENEMENVYFIKDNGVGFDMRYAHKLFGVFQRLHRQEDYEGTGVGLAIVQRIINRHNGRVWAEATINHGATFYFSLPLEGARSHVTAD